MRSNNPPLNARKVIIQRGNYLDYYESSGDHVNETPYDRMESSNSKFQIILLFRINAIMRSIIQQPTLNNRLNGYRFR